MSMTHVPENYRPDDAAWPAGDPLDQALSAALAPPPVPVGFREALRVAIRHQAEQELLARRQALETDYTARLAELQAGYVRVRRNTLLTVLALAFALGAGAMLVLPWLAAELGIDPSTLVLAGTTLIGLGLGAVAPRLAAFRLPRLI